MGTRYWRQLAASLGLWIGALTPAYAQYQEDSMEPAKIGIRDIGALSIPEAAYAGNDVCRSCHEAAYQKWLTTAHSRAFVPMRSMMGMMMGMQQGVTACCPAKSGKCLPCHATAHNVPAAFRAPGFRMGEGVACEKCHGPGADHVRAMESSQSGADGAVTVPGAASCRACHKTKTSHEKLESGPFDVAKAQKKIAHPMSAERSEDRMDPEKLGIWHLQQHTGSPVGYVGSMVCGRCHQGAYQTWVESQHARSFGALRTEMGYMMDRMGSVVTVGGPAKNGMCLSCHATAHNVPAVYRGSGFRMREGVGCEKCHGPGADHVRAMERAEAGGTGLPYHPDEISCQNCHKRKRSHAKLDARAFSFAPAWAEITHGK